MVPIMSIVYLNGCVEPKNISIFTKPNAHYLGISLGIIGTLIREKWGKFAQSSFKVRTNGHVETNLS